MRKRPYQPSGLAIFVVVEAPKTKRDNVFKKQERKRGKGGGCEAERTELSTAFVSSVASMEGFGEVTLAGPSLTPRGIGSPQLYGLQLL